MRGLILWDRWLVIIICICTSTKHIIVIVEVVSGIVVLITID
jgi:hypothetical protein